MQKTVSLKLLSYAPGTVARSLLTRLKSIAIASKHHIQTQSRKCRSPYLQLSEKTPIVFDSSVAAILPEPMSFVKVRYGHPDSIEEFPEFKTSQGPDRYLARNHPELVEG
jgi:hypothetical protein